MAKYRKSLPQLQGDEIFLSDGGIETSLIYQGGFDLPNFSAFHLMRTGAGRDGLRAYYRPYAAIAAESRLGFVLESPTWRANPDWAAKLGYAPEALHTVNCDSIALMDELRREFETPRSPIVVSGAIGPRGDGYRPGELMSATEAEGYHATQISSFRSAGADMVAAVTMNYVEEAIGIARAAANAGMPSAISFTVETDGRLATGQALGDAIMQVDRETGSAPAYYMINCAHPVHFETTLAGGGAWVDRIAGLRANASRKSHAELDAATELDAGDPRDLGERYAELKRKHSRLTVFGGCCGTDHRHVREICLACMAVA
jgi:S-methylmethionine-dependent homocysteine/selenocysteine methylase